MEIFKYRLYGLNLSSELECPGLISSDHHSPDIVIKRGTISCSNLERNGKAAIYKADYQDFFFYQERIGSFRVQNGHNITIDPKINTIQNELLLFVLGPGIGAILHQRGILPLHGCAIEFNNSAIIIVGDSKVGKSSIAAGFNKLGYPIIADDISAISKLEGDNFIVHRGIPFLKLNKDVVNYLNWTNELELLGQGFSKYKTKVLSFSKYDNLPVHLVLILSINHKGEFNFKKVNGGAKFFQLRENIYRLNYTNNLHSTRTLFSNLSTFAKSLKLYKVTRPDEPLQIKELVTVIKEEFLN